MRLLRLARENQRWDLAAYTIVFAFSLMDERQHSPNEFFRLSGYERGQKAYGMLLHRLGEELRK